MKCDTVDRALEIMNEALSHQIANRDTDAEFYKCYTYPYGKLPDWVVRTKAFIRDFSDKEDD